MRSDVNISIRPVGSPTLGTKVEIKNMNSFSGIHAALVYEARRQRACVAQGVPIVQETRRWDPEALETASMRTKENAHDYRYFPNPTSCPSRSRTSRSTPGAGSSRSPRRAVRG